MTGKRLFFLSLIVLSVAMGMHWFKNRPKPRPRRAQPRTALRLDDLQLNDQQENENQDDDSQKQPDDPEFDDDVDSDADPASDDPDKDDSDSEDSETDIEDPDGENQETGENGEEQSDTEVAADDAIASDDPVIIALHNLPRNPFQRSPYAILMDELRAQQGMAANEGEEAEEIQARQVRQLNANFSATIQTERELVAVIDSALYRKGESFQGREITEINEEYVSLETPNELLLIPKHGVNINIDEKGKYTVADTFRQ